MRLTGTTLQRFGVALYWVAGTLLGLVIGLRIAESEAANTQALEQLITLQLALGVLPITAATAATQIHAGQLTFALGRALSAVNQAAQPILLLLLSAVLDVALLAGGPTSGPLQGAATFVALLTTLFALRRAHLMLRDTFDEEALLRGALGRGVTWAWVLKARAALLDATETKTVQDPVTAPPVVSSDSPLAVPLGLLQAGLTKGDRALFERVLAKMAQHIVVLVRKGVAQCGLDPGAQFARIDAALDVVLADELSPLIAAAGSVRADAFLAKLVAFRDDFEPNPQDEAGYGPAYFAPMWHGTPTGVLLTTRVFVTAARQNLEEAAYRALDYNRSYLGAVLVDEQIANERHRAQAQLAFAQLLELYEISGLDAASADRRGIARHVVNECLLIGYMARATSDITSTELAAHVEQLTDRTACRIVSRAARNGWCALRFYPYQEWELPSRGTSVKSTPMKRPDDFIGPFMSCVAAAGASLDIEAAKVVRGLSVVRSVQVRRALAGQAAMTNGLDPEVARQLAGLLPAPGGVATTP